MKERILPYYTYYDRLHWKGRWELIDGLAFSLLSSSEPNHQRICTNMNAELCLALKGNNKYFGYSSIDYLVTDDTVLQPDIIIIDEKITKKYLDFTPVLVAEIRSPATKYNDRHTKFAIYETQGIKNYIIVAPEKEEV